MLDSGSSVSLIDKASLPTMCSLSRKIPQLQSADGHTCRHCVIETVQIQIQLGHFSTRHEFLVTNRQITPVILGIEIELTDVLDSNIIRVSSSPWLAPAVYVPKKSGEIQICTDFRELNKQTKKDAYPLSLPNEVQDQLAGSKVFSKLHMHSGYWQLPVKEADCMKIAFRPDPGMGLYDFCRMPFGVMDKVLPLAFVTCYIDDMLVLSANMICHFEHQQNVFERLTTTGLTLRGSKCQLGLHKVHYLGHILSESGTDREKIATIKDWQLSLSLETSPILSIYAKIMYFVKS